MSTCTTVWPGPNKQLVIYSKVISTECVATVIEIPYLGGQRLSAEYPDVSHFPRVCDSSAVRMSLPRPPEACAKKILARVQLVTYLRSS